MTESITINLTKLQADEISWRLSLNEQSQREQHQEDRLPVWGQVTGKVLTVWSLTDCLCDIDTIIEGWVAESRGYDPFRGQAGLRTMRNLREKITALAV